MRADYLLFAVVPVFCLLAWPARATEHAEELWRSRYGSVGLYPNPRHVAAANPTDGTIWLVEGANVTHLSPDGTVVFRSKALYAPCALAVDPANGSCWVLQDLSDQLLHFAVDGTLLSATPGHNAYEASVTPSPAEGSAWVTGYEYIAHVNAAGQEVWRANWRSFPVVVDPNDGSVWMCDSDSPVTVHLRADGSEIWRAPVAARAADEDLRDQSVWVGETHISSSGVVIGQLASSASGPELSTSAIGSPASNAIPRPGESGSSVHVSALDGSIWFWSAWVGHGEAPPGSVVTHYDSSGRLLWQASDAWLIAHNDGDGSVWILNSEASGWLLLQISADDQELHRIPLPRSAVVVAYDPMGDSLWVNDGSTRKLLRLNADGEVLWQDRVLSLGPTLWLDPSDGSCWTVDGDECVHFSPAGAELERRPLSVNSSSLSQVCISPVDGSWWLSATNLSLDSAASLTIHLSKDGTELWRRTGLGWDLAVNESDGSVWTTSGTWGMNPDNSIWASGRVYHLAADGSELWTAEFPYVLSSPAVNGGDGSVWVVATDFAIPRVVHVSSSGEVLDEVPFGSPVQAIAAITVSPSDGSVYGTAESRAGVTGDFESHAFRMAGDGNLMWLRNGFVIPGAIGLNAADGSVWVADAGSGAEEFSPGSAVVHLAADGTELWRGGTFNAPLDIEVSRLDGSVWIVDWFNGQLVHLAARTSPFSDVPGDFWAWDAIWACSDAGIVSGYSDGTYHPEGTVTRDQMATYIARALAGGDAKVPTGPATATFPDVPIGHWAYKYIEYAAAKGIVTGYPDGTYQPSITLDRAQMAAFIARATAIPTGEAGVPDPGCHAPVFPDVPCEFWARKYVQFIKGKGVTSGYPDGLYHPEYTCTRDQMAVYLARAFRLAR
jgi:hypothetical protein